LSVEWKKLKWVSDRDGIIELEPGQICTGRKKMARLLNLSERQIRSALGLLVNGQIIAIKSTKRYSIITVKNWSKYQSSEIILPSERPTDDQQTTTVLRTKELKNIPKASAFTDYFYQKHLEAHGQKPNPPKWVFKACQAPLQALGLQELCRRADNYFADPYTKVHPLPDFINNVDKWIASRPKFTKTGVDQQVQADRKRTAF
jgi:hypothetical protein